MSEPAEDQERMADRSERGEAPSLTQSEQAAAFHGLAINPTVSPGDRLELALQALNLYEAEVERLREQVRAAYRAGREDTARDIEASSRPGMRRLHAQEILDREPADHILACGLDRYCNELVCGTRTGAECFAAGHNWRVISEYEVDQPRTLQAAQGSSPLGTSLEYRGQRRLRAGVGGLP